MSGEVMTFDDLRAYCRRNGDEPAAVEKFIAWAENNIGHFFKFEQVAMEQMKTEEKGDPMICMGITRKRYGVMIPNAAAPGLCRMVNCKHRRRFFQVNRMKTFNEKLAA